MAERRSGSLRTWLVRASTLLAISGIVAAAIVFVPQYLTATGYARKLTGTGQNVVLTLTRMDGIASGLPATFRMTDILWPKESQVCPNPATGRPNASCSEVAEAVLVNTLRQATVTCTVGSPIDAFSEIMDGTCAVEGMDLGGLLVSNGLALPAGYSPESGKYGDQMRQACGRGAGMWWGTGGSCSIGALSE